MKFFTAVTLLATAALANPLTRARREFHLKTMGAKNTNHNNLFIYAYHTGAGLNDAVLDKNGANASPFYFNGTQALADLGTDFPWGLIATGDTNYACTSPDRHHLIDLCLVVIRCVRANLICASLGTDRDKCRRR